MIVMDVYSRKECKVIKNFQPVNTLAEAEQALKKYCEENNISVIAKEKCGDSYWNYLSNDTEFDYTIENSEEQFEKAWNSKMAQIEMKYEETL